MDITTLSQLHRVFLEVQKQQDWKAALDTLFLSMRAAFEARIDRGYEKAKKTHMKATSAGM